MSKAILSTQFAENFNQNSSLCSPNGNFNISDIQKLENLYKKLSNCGNTFVEYANKYTSELKQVPQYCNNRVCTNPDCKEHRGYLYFKNHRGQIDYLKENIRSPKAWIFTGWSIPIEKINRKFLQNKLKKLNSILSNFSTSSYSIHMEIKLYPLEHKNYGKAYIHFHVVSGGINNLKLARRIWNRQVSYEKALCYDNLSKYISKYASKTPNMESSSDLELYHLLVYKLQMHRFSVKRGDCSPLTVESSFINMDSLEAEVYYCLKKASDRHGYYYPYVENYKRRGKPPPINLNNFGSEEN